MASSTGLPASLAAVIDGLLDPRRHCCLLEGDYEGPRLQVDRVRLSPCHQPLGLLMVLARCCNSPNTLSICSSAARRSSAISSAKMCGSGKLAESSSDSSLSQKMSRLHLSRATNSS